LDPPVQASPWSPSGRIPPTLGFGTEKARDGVEGNAGGAGLEKIVPAAGDMTFGEGGGGGLAGMLKVR